MNRQYFSEVVLDTVQANIRTQESFSAWDITKQVRQLIESDENFELLDCPMIANGSMYSIEHNRVKSLVHQFMDIMLEFTEYNSFDTGKYIEYRYVDPNNDVKDYPCDLADDSKDEFSCDDDLNICDASCNFCSCDEVIPLATTTASADWRDTKPSPKINSGLPDYNEALTILRNYGLLK